MKLSVWIFIGGIFSTLISGCGSTHTAASNSVLENTCSVVLPENLTLISPYTGNCLNGLAHGHGNVIVEKTYPLSGEKFIITYDGMFQHGQLTGEGKETEKFGNHSYEGTFYEWKRWTGAVHFAKLTKQKKRQIYLRDGSVISYPVDVTQDPLYYSQASYTDEDIKSPLAQGVQEVRSLRFYGMDLRIPPNIDAAVTSPIGCLVLQVQPDSLAYELGIEGAGLIITRYGHQNLATGCQDIDEISKLWKNDEGPGELQITNRDGMIGAGEVSIPQLRQAQMNLDRDSREEKSRQ